MALKVALAEFGAMETLAGIEMLPVDVNPTLAPTATGLLNVTVHTDTAPGAREDGLQEVPLRTEIVALAVAPDGGRAACASDRGRVVVWDLDV